MSFDAFPRLLQKWNSEFSDCFGAPFLQFFTKSKFISLSQVGATPYVRSERVLEWLIVHLLELVRVQILKLGRRNSSSQVGDLATSLNSSSWVGSKAYPPQTNTATGKTLSSLGRLAALLAGPKPFSSWRPSGLDLILVKLAALRFGFEVFLVAFALCQVCTKPPTLGTLLNQLCT